jgi:hypothetical protein
MFNRKPYRTEAQKAQARRTARKEADGAWRSDAAFSLHGEPGEWFWDASHKVPVRGDAKAGGADAGGDDQKLRSKLRSQRP